MKLLLSGCLVINEKKEILLLFKKKHQHYETPGGKVEIQNPTQQDLIDEALRELHEEVKNIVVKNSKYYCAIDMVIPDGRQAIAHKIIVEYVSGNPDINEPAFEHCKWIPLKELNKYPIGPGLKKIADELKDL